MAIRQEQIVLLGTVLILGYLVSSGIGKDSGRSRASKQAPEFKHHIAPDVDLARPHSRELGDLSRELFAAPRDTRPLPPLAFMAPPLEALSVLRPTPSAGPAPALFGRFLRTDFVSKAVPELFAEEEPTLSDGAEDEYAIEVDADVSLLTSEERMERIASYKRTYDWIDMGGLHFGQIRNKDRYGLATRLADGVEAGIEFVEFLPETGAERWPGQPPIVYGPDRFETFAFADTPENDIELRRLQFTGDLTPGQFTRVVDFAAYCLAKRFETPRALEVAAEMYERAIPLDTQNPMPRLGLAYCHEAAFEFEEAFAIYDELVQGAFGDHPEVLSRLAQLEARFRMAGRAEEHFRQAESYGRTLWLVQWDFGRFLLETERAAEAVEHLRLANQYEPKAAEYQSLRAEIRTDLANALVAIGEIEEGRALYARALQADPTAQRATAGLIAADYLLGRQAEPAEPGDTNVEGAGFELLMVMGLSAMDSGDAMGARDSLMLAAATDPLRAYQAWRALSYLAETTGHLSEAMYYIDLAEANAPGDVYTLFQRGRILALNDDESGAMASFSKALDRELELPDTLAAMGRLEMLAGDYENAERYFERSVGIDTGLAAAHTLRGLNALFMERPALAQEHFDYALQYDEDDPVASCGRAWCAYAEGDPTEAKTRFREFEDSRRHLGEEDSYRVYANEQIDRIGDHQEKMVWSDRFERQDLRNGWSLDEVTATTVFLREGRAVIEGNFDKAGRTRLKREYTSGDFVSLEATITIHSGTRVRTGIFVGLEQRRTARAEDRVTAEVSLSRNPDGTIQYRSMRRGRKDDLYVDSRVMTWADEQPITLRLERYGESAKTAFRVLVDGVPIQERLTMPSLGATTREIVVGVFAEGEPGRPVSIEIDDIEIVKRERK